MTTKRSSATSDDRKRAIEERKIQRAIILLVLKPENVTQRSQLETRLSHYEPLAVNNAIDSLSQAGALNVNGETVGPSTALERVDALELIGL
jgi:hypothetical protein